MIRALMVLGALLGAPAIACETPASLIALRAELLALSNVERAEAGLSALTRDARLEAAAQAQACRTADRQRLNHRGSWFAGLGRRLRREGYPYAMAAENLAEGQHSATVVTAGWMASPEHRRNLLDPRARNAGFGVAVAENGRLHWSMVLASLR
ncbi:CAP domain-containing protein [Pararhodobacter sp.]|uniref:CAP domain-containing protein n=1 Tax=Pararhodobacter sp. TaxID=2127056 RepID=UPI002AFF9D33|nr:CAP domain-containing protein [Pararhodobacter sp.]